MSMIYHSLDLFRGAATHGRVDMRTSLTRDVSIATDPVSLLGLYLPHTWPDVSLLWRDVRELERFFAHIEEIAELLVQLRVHYQVRYPPPSSLDLHHVESILRNRERRQSFHGIRREPERPDFA